MDIGLLIVLIACILAAFNLVRGLRGHIFRLGGHEVSWSSNRFYFWFAMGVWALVLAIGAWMLPLWWATLS